MLVTNAAKRIELPVELPVAVQEVWFVLARRTVVGAAVIGVAVVKLVSTPEQPVHSHRPRQVLEKGHTISLSPRL